MHKIMNSTKNLQAYRNTGSCSPQFLVQLLKLHDACLHGQPQLLGPLHQAAVIVRVIRHRHPQATAHHRQNLPSANCTVVLPTILN